MISVNPGRSESIDRLHKSEDSLSLYSQAGVLRLMPINRTMIRVSFSPDGAFPDTEKPALMPQPSFQDWTVEENAEEIRLCTAGLSVSVNRAHGSCRFRDAAGRLLLSEREKNCRTLEEFEAFRLSPDGQMEKERVKTADGEKEVIKEAARVSEGTFLHTRVHFSWQEEEALYGLGQHEEGLLNLRGQTLYLHQANRKIAVPMLVSSLGYGLFFHEYSPMIFSDSVYGSYVYCEAAKEIDYFFIFGGDADGVIRGYRTLTGKAALLPRWAFGYVQSQERYEDAAELLETVENFRQKGIGLDCIVQDWMTWPDGEWGQKSFDASRYPDPSDMMKRLHAQHAKLMISIWPNMHASTRNHKEFRDAGLLLPGSEVYDAFRADARALYWKQVCDGLFCHDIDAWWCDSSEPYTAEWMHREKPEPARMYEEYVRQSGDHMPVSLTNAFSFYHAQAIYEGQRSGNTGKRVVNLTRSATAGQQRFGTVLWSGDTAASWDTFRRQIPAGLNFCASGLPYWTNDIGAFFVRPGDMWYWKGEYDDTVRDPAYCELYVRWFQYACFLPMFRAHGTDCRREPWQFMAENGKYYDALLKTIRLRYSLLPHIYSLAGLAWLQDQSVIRMLPFDYPDDPEARACTTQFMLGREMLVCPVTDPGATRMSVYLPAGDWCDYRTGERFSGGRRIERAVTLDEIPVFVKAGSIIPAMEPGQWAYTGRLADGEVRLIFRVYPGADATYTLYDDEGDGFGYEQGDYTLHRLTWDDSRQELDTGALRGEVIIAPFD